MSKSLDPLETTTPELHRFWFLISTESQWYAIMQECRSWFGRNWRGMSKVRKKLRYRYGTPHETSLPVWFEVPDSRFATWISVKLSLQVRSDAKHKANK